MDKVEKVARAIYDEMEGPVANQDFARQTRQWELAQRLAEAALAAMGEREAVAWVIPGDDNARDGGFIDAKCYRDGEFTQPLYASPRPEAVGEAVKAEMAQPTNEKGAG